MVTEIDRDRCSLGDKGTHPWGKHTCWRLRGYLVSN